METLINEEALLFAKFLRDERETCKPRTSVIFLEKIESISLGKAHILKDLSS
jgi:hypothetical protein